MKTNLLERGATYEEVCENFHGTSQKNIILPLMSVTVGQMILLE